MKTLRLLPAAVLLIAAAPKSDEAELKAITQEMLDAIAPGHAEVWDKYLDPQVIYVDENDKILTKADLLKDFKPLPAGIKGESRVDGWTAVVHGNVAVTTHENQEQVDYHGQKIHTRFRVTDTWVKTPQGWRLIGEQVMGVLKDPPPMANPPKCDQAGRYRLDAEIEATVTCTSNGIASARPGRPVTAMTVEAPDVFFTPGSPRSRRIFFRDAAGKITGFGDRREGEDIVWTKAG